jgi:capsular exopolysaccharide synthesis family protein
MSSFADVGSDSDRASPELLGGLFRRKWLVLFFTSVGLGLAYLYFLREPPVYQSGARILVIKEEISQLPVQGVARNGGYEDSLATQMLLIRSPLIVDGAVTAKRLNTLKMFSQTPDVAAKITASLEARAASSSTYERSSVMDIIYRGSVSEECQIVVDAILDSYEEFLRETHHNVSKETVDLITQAKETLTKEIEKKEDAYRDFRVKAPLVFTKEGTLNVHRTRLTQIESTRSNLMISKSQTKAQLQALETAVKRGGNREALMLLMDKSVAGEMKNAGGKMGIAGELFPLLLEEQMLLEDHGADHPKIRAVRKRINLTRNHLRMLSSGDPPAEGEEAADEYKGSQPVDFIVVYMESLREDIRAIDSKLKDLDELFDEETDEAKQLTTAEIEDENRRKDIARSNQLFEGIVKRLEEINLIQDYGKLKTKKLHGASPGIQVAPVMARILGMGGALGFFLGCGLAILLELADKRFRSPEEISESLRLPVIGHIPYVSPGEYDDDSAIDRTICLHHQPRSKWAESYRGIRTALYFSTRGEGHKVIQVSSPNPGDGKSTLAANLAVAIAQSSKKVLLIESDFRRPRVHKLMGIDSEIGVTSVIDGTVELADGIQETEIENLFAMGCGPRPSNPSELLSSQRYAELLGILREKFDYVIVDTPPLMAVTDPVVVAPRVDGVVLSIRIQKRSRQDCTRTTDMLMSVGAKILGVVVNGVDQRDRYGYGYAGTYRYSSNSGAYGGYTDFIYDDTYSSYYEADEEEEDEPIPRKSKKRTKNFPPTASA